MPTHQTKETRERLEAELRERCINRRRLLQVAVGGGGAAALGSGGFGMRFSLASAAAQEAEPDAEQVMYHFVLQNEPLTFDWNSNLYASADPETFSGLLKFDPDGNPWTIQERPRRDG